jgi:hypothetical protein
MTDWRAWHADYEDPTTSLARRLGVVRARLTELLAGGAVRSVLSLCAGDGRDVLPVLAEQPAERRPQVTLVELDPVLATAARDRAVDVGVQVRVLTGDAGRTATWHDAVPVDLLLLCGVFGNVPDDDVHRTITSCPALLETGGAVVWTRGDRDGTDLRPRIRGWFDEAGFVELAFDAEPVGYGVGVHRLRSPAPAPATDVPGRLFAFER